MVYCFWFVVLLPRIADLFKLYELSTRHGEEKKHPNPPRRGEKSYTQSSWLSFHICGIATRKYK